MSSFKDMGEKASDIFAGKTATSKVIDELFNQTPILFSTALREEVGGLDVKGKPFSLLDIGSYKGELLERILSRLPEMQFETTATDENEQALSLNKIAYHTIQSPASMLPFGDKSFDFAIMRYVLHWNNLEEQLRILSEAVRVTKNCVLIQHLGAPDSDGASWEESFQELVGGAIQKLYRPTACFSSAKTIENHLETLSVEFSRIQYRKIESPSQGFKERFDLNDDEFDRVKQILGHNDYIFQTTWKIEPRIVV